MIQYMCFVKPWDARNQNRLEIANEVTIMFLMYHNILFGMVTDVEIKYNYVGESMIYTTITQLVLNCLVIFYGVYR